MSDKRKENTSLNDTLNFDDLDGKTVQKPKRKVERSRKATDSGYILCVPKNNKWISNNYELKDLTQMSASEFIRWTQMVYPIDLSRYEEVFEHPKKRLKMLDKILRFHMFSIFNGKPNNDFSVEH